MLKSEFVRTERVRANCSELFELLCGQWSSIETYYVVMVRENEEIYVRVSHESLQRNLRGIGSVDIEVSVISGHIDSIYIGVEL